MWKQKAGQNSNAGGNAMYGTKPQMNNAGMVSMNTPQIGYQMDIQEEDYDGEWVRLDEEMDESYQPTETDVREYAQFLGMDLERDKKYFYIAKEGLKAPLPEQWHPYQNRYDEQVYYINSETGQKQLEHPCDEFYKKKFEETKMKDQQKVDLCPFFMNIYILLESKSKQASKQQAFSIEFDWSFLCRLFDLIQQAGALIKQNQEKQDMNEGFVGDSRVLDTSLNQSFNQVNMPYGNAELYEQDEFTTQKIIVDRELQGEQEQFEGELMVKYKNQSVEYENIRKKEQKEIDKQIEREFKDLRQSIKEAEKVQSKRVATEKKEFQKRIEADEQRTHQASIQELQSRLNEQKHDVDEEKSAWVDRQARLYSDELSDKYRIKDRAVEQKRQERQAYQAEHDEKFRDGKQRVQAAFSEYKEKIEGEMLIKFRNAEREQARLEADEESIFLKDLISNNETKKAELQETLNQIKSDLKARQIRITKACEDQFSKRSEELLRNHELRLKQFGASNEIGKNDLILAEEFERTRQLKLTQHASVFESEKLDMELKISNKLSTLQRETDSKYQNLTEEVRSEGNTKLNAVKNQFKLSSDLDTNSFELIYEKQSILHKMEAIKEEIGKIELVHLKNKRIDEQLSGEKRILQEISETHFPKQSRLWLSVLSFENVEELQGKVEKLKSQLVEKTAQVSKLEESKDEKKREIHTRKKQNIEFQKEMMLIKEQQKLRKAENIQSKLKFEEILHEIGHIKQTINNESIKPGNNPLRKSRDSPSRVLKSQEDQEWPGENNYRSVQDANRPKRRPTSSRSARADTEHFFTPTTSTRRRIWMNKLIEERNILLDSKRSINNKIEQLRGLEASISNDQLRLREELQVSAMLGEPSDLKKSAYQTLRANVNLNVERFNAEKQALKEQEMLFVMKDRSLVNMEKLFEEVQDERLGKAFNEDTFTQLYQVYRSLSIPKQDFAQETLVRDHSSGEGRFAHRFSHSIDPTNPIAEQDELTIDKTTISIQNNFNSFTQANLMSGSAAHFDFAQNQQVSNLQQPINPLRLSQNASALLSTSNSGCDIKSALLSLKQKHTIPQNSSSSSLLEPQRRSKSPFEDPLMQNIKKRMVQEQDSHYASYSNWYQSMKNELNSVLLDGPFSKSTVGNSFVR